MTEEVEPTKPTGIVSIDDSEGICPVHVPVLARAAAAERALTTLQAIRLYWRAFLWCMFMSIGAIMCGYDGQIGGGLLSVPQFRADFGYTWNGNPVLPASWQSAFSSVGITGSMLGGLAMGWTSDKLGRRAAVTLACIISIVGVSIKFLSPAHANGVLLIGRLINGFALGIYIACAPSYCVEMSPLPLRGITIATVSLWIVLGQLMGSCVIRETGSWTNAYAYRLPFALQWIFPAILLVGLLFAPESPWWLIRRGRYEDADYILSALGGPTVDARLQREQIRETIELENSYTATSTYIDCFRGKNLKRTAVAMMVFVLQQGAGVSFVMGFSTYFFELAGFPMSNAFDLGVGVTAIGVFGNILAIYGVNRLGRRFLFNWGMVVCTIILLLIGFVWIGNANQEAKWVVSAFTIIYNLVYQFTLGPVGYVLFAEVPSAKLRSKTVGIGICTGAFCAMLTHIIIPYLVNPDEANLGGYVGFIFGGISFAGSIWTYFFIPETKGRTVDELDLLYEKGVSERHFRTYQLYDENGDRV